MKLALLKSWRAVLRKEPGQVPTRRLTPHGSPVASRRRARAVVLCGGGAVLLALVGMALAVETIRPQWRDPEYGHRMKELSRTVRLERRLGTARPLVVLVGSSRSQLGFSPLHLGLGDGPGRPLVYNLSHTGYGSVGELLLTHRLFDNDLTPDALIVEVLPPRLTEDHVPGFLFPPERLGYRDLDRLAPYLDDPARMRKDWAQSRVTTWHALRFLLLNHWGAGRWLPTRLRQEFVWESIRSGGWLQYEPPPLPPEQRAAAMARARGDFAGAFERFRVEPLQDRAYRDLLAACRGRGVRVAFLLMPESPTFRAWYPPGALAEVRAYLAKLAGEHGCAVFDASEWFADEELFADGHHLLGPGARAFSKRLGAEYLGPWLGVKPE